MSAVDSADPEALIASLPPPLAARLECVASGADELGASVWWVGGGVRDLLLGRIGPDDDLDLVVEVDPAPLAESVRKRLGGRAIAHERFLTLSLETPGGDRIDFARSRTESYPEPGALPRVEPAPIQADLSRRDFALNAIALRLWPRPAELLDPCSGRRDLRAGRLRILHLGSFRDDPTRILRGIRFETRLGFSFDAATERAAREALTGGALGTLSRDRLRRELELLFESWEDAAATSARLDDLGVTRSLGVRATRRATAILRAAARRRPGLAFARHGLGSPTPWGVYRRALALEADEDERRALIERLFAGAERRRRLGERDRIREAESLVLDPLRRPHERSLALDRLAAEELLLLAALGERAAGAVERYLADQRGLELTIRGSDLIAAGVPPGPAVGEALRETRNARLDGEIDAGRELAHALRAARAGSPR